MINNGPLISVIVATRNGERFLHEQLKSLEAQTYPNLEFICSDNNSTDGTAEILEAWCNASENRTFIRCREDGLNKNFFTAIPFTTGDYIMFSDQDDVWLPEKIEALVSFHLSHPEASMVYCLSKPFENELPPSPEMKDGINRLEGTEIKKTLLISFTLGHNMLIKKNVLEKIKVPGDEVIAYDWWITVSAMCIGPVYCLQKVFTYWRQHPENTTKKINDVLFYQSRISYLEKFAGNNLVSPSTKDWIKKAVDALSSLSDKKFSFKLFNFYLSNAAQIFFYKKKSSPISRYISHVKMAYRMSFHDYRP